MKAKGVKRLVLLSSFGIGDDFMPSSFIKVLSHHSHDVLGMLLINASISMLKRTLIAYSCFRPVST
jgi:hypothetical protein